MTGEKVVRDGDVEFVAIERAHLDRAAVVAQCLDDRWVPRWMLRRMVERGESLADVAGERTAIVRGEYLRALLCARQVVVGRASLYADPAVAADVLGSSGDHEALVRLLDAGVVVPLLLGESSPVDPPQHRVDGHGFAAWQRVCHEVRARCLRLSWADEANARAIQDRLHLRFGWFAGGVHQLDVPALRRELGLHADAEPELQKLLARVALWCARWAGEGRAITRDDLYRRFVVVDDTPPGEGRCDRSKPFAGELKRLLDLGHFVHLPDALERFPLVPADSLSRSALQEWRLPGSPAHAVSAPDLVERIRAAAVPVAEGGAYVGSPGVLGLVEVETIRGTDAWAAYAEQLEALLDAPFDFADAARGLFQRYVRLAQLATSVAMRRNPRVRTERWVPALELLVQAGGGTLSVVPGLLGRDAAACQVAGRVSGRAAGEALPVSLRLVIRGLARRGSRADLGIGLPLFRGRLEDAVGQWQELLTAFGQAQRDDRDGAELAAERVPALERCEPGPP
jgi:hypothetical protein